MGNPVFYLDAPLFTYGKTPYNQSVYLFQQWFISNRVDRHKENVVVLQKNIENPEIDRIYLLNERDYTWEELGVPETEKVIQIIVGTRLTYGLAWNTMRELGIHGYCILANLDIFFDDALKKLAYSSYHMTPTCITGARRDYHPSSYIHTLIENREDTSGNHLTHEEYIHQLQTTTYEIPCLNGGNTVNTVHPVYQPELDAYCVPRALLSDCSQDVWIIHSKWIHYCGLQNNNCLGTQGCDNKILTYLYQKHIDIVNGTFEIPMYHYHTSQYRTYPVTPSNGIYTFITSPLTSTQRQCIYHTITPFIELGIYKDCSTKYVENDKTFQETLSKNMEDSQKLIPFLSSYKMIKDKHTTPFYISCLDIQTCFLSKLYFRIKHNKAMARELDSTEVDIFEIVLYRLFITLYSKEKNTFNIRMNKNTLYRDLDFLSSFYSYIHSNPKPTRTKHISNSIHKRLTYILSHIETSMEQTDGCLFTNYGITSAIHLLFKSTPKDSILDTILDKKQILFYEAFNPLFFYNRICWTHQLSGLSVGVLSSYSKEIQENQENWDTCYERPLFVGNTFSFMDLPEIEPRQIHRVYDTIYTQVIHNQDTDQESHNQYASELYVSARNTNKTVYLEYIQYTEKVKTWLQDIDILLLDASMMNSFIMRSAIQTKTSCIVLGELLRLYFGVYTQDDIDWYRESMWMVNDSWKKV